MISLVVSFTYILQPGALVQMKRSEVDDNPNNTCSKGLHAAAYRYAKDFGGHHTRLMEIKINPKHVVCVPQDYNGEKMRVCEYIVLQECEKMREDVYYDGDEE